MAAIWPDDDGRDTEENDRNCRCDERRVSRAVFCELSDEAEVGTAEVASIHGLVNCWRNVRRQVRFVHRTDRLLFYTRSTIKRKSTVRVAP